MGTDGHGPKRPRGGRLEMKEMTERADLLIRARSEHRKGRKRDYFLDLKARGIPQAKASAMRPRVEAASGTGWTADTSAVKPMF